MCESVCDGGGKGGVSLFNPRGDPGLLDLRRQHGQRGVEREGEPQEGPGHRGPTSKFTGPFSKEKYSYL